MPFPDDYEVINWSNDEDRYTGIFNKCSYEKEDKSDAVPHGLMLHIPRDLTYVHWYMTQGEGWEHNSNGSTGLSLILYRNGECVWQELQDGKTEFKGRGESTEKKAKKALKSIL